jgi:hypothetical protein
MKHRNRIASWIVSAAAVLALAGALSVSAQTEVAKAPGAAQTHRHAEAGPAQPPTDQDVVTTQKQFLKLLRLSPVLTTVVARDPSLLADQNYVARNNPELAQFMASHPDIAKNPEFYLFSQLDNEGGRHREQALERAVWPDLTPLPPSQQQQESVAPRVIEKFTPIIIVPAVFFAIVWIINLFIQGRRWNRTYKQQAELHMRLIDKFGTSQELAAYLETEAGKRFLMAGPVVPGEGASQRMPNAVARVLTPLQVGVVMTLLGIGLLFLRHAGPDMETAMTVLGVLALMPGLGFILSAGATWVLAHRLGLMPEKEIAKTGAAAPFGSQDRQ